MMNLAVSWLCFVVEIAVLLWCQLHYMLIDKRVISLPPSLSPSLLHFPPLPGFPFFCGVVVVVVVVVVCLFLGFLGCTGSLSIAAQTSSEWGLPSCYSAWASLALASFVAEPGF